MTLSPSARRAWLRLARTPTIGPVTHAALLRRFGDPETALDRVPTLTKGAVKPIDSAAIDLEFEAIAALGGVLLTPADPDFPSWPSGAQPAPAGGDGARQPRPAAPALRGPRRQP